MRAALLALALLAGCAAAPPPAEEEPVPTTSVRADAPDFGNPRPKLSPDDARATDS